MFWYPIILNSENKIFDKTLKFYYINLEIPVNKGCKYEPEMDY